MADPFGRGDSSKSSGKDPFGRTGPVKKSGHHHGILGAVAKYSGADLAGNFGKDVGEAAVQFGPSVAKVATSAAKDTKYYATGGAFTHKDEKQGQHFLNDVVKPTAKSYKDYYGHDVGHHIYKHPLQPLLDAATVADLGSTAAVRAGLLPERGAAIVTRSPRKIATGKGPVNAELGSTKPVVRVRERAVHNLRSSERLRERRGGEVERYGKQIQAHATQAAHGRLTHYEPYHQATRRLRPDEWTALHVRALDVHPDDLARLWKDTPAGQELTAKVKQLALHPSKRMLRAEPEARALSEQGAKLYRERGKLKDETASARPELTKRQASEMLGRPLPLRPGYIRLYRGEGKTAPIASDTKDFYGAGYDVGGWFTDTLPVAEEYARRNNGTVHYVDVPKDVARPWSRQRESDQGQKWTEYRFPNDKYASLISQKTALNGSKPIREITGKPYYFPHTLEPPRNVSPLTASGGGKAVPAKLGSMKQSTGALSLKGKLHLRGDVLGPDFLRRVKYVKYDEVHNALVRGAVRVTRQQLEEQHSGRLPKGWEYVREKASTRIPPTIRGEGTQHVPIDKLVPNPEDLHDSTLAEGFTTQEPTQAHHSGGAYYIVPKRTARAATGEFTKSSDFTRNFVRRPLQVWRAAVLGLRVGFLTNNLVGNSLMYAVKTGGQGALRDLYGAIRESHGPEVARKILDDPSTPPKLRADLYKEHFPEQLHGTFGRTQTPAVSPVHLTGRKIVEAGRAVTSPLPQLTSKIAEEYPRRALVRHYIRHSPEFKRVYSQLPKQTRSFEAAARKVLEGKGGKPYQRHISKQVNQALGDYLNLSPTERNVLRNVFPFYAWYRAITTTTYHLAADTPARADALAAISRLNNDQPEGAVPSFLRAAVPLGEGANGTKRVLGTQGLNPYATLPQLVRGATTDISSLGLNPFVEEALQAYKNGSVSPVSLASGTLYAIARGLPPARVAFPQKPSRLYPNRNRKSELLGFLGAPIKEYDPAAARYQASKGR